MSLSLCMINIIHVALHSINIDSNTPYIAKADLDFSPNFNYSDWWNDYSLICKAYVIGEQLIIIKVTNYYQICQRTITQQKQTIAYNVRRDRREANKDS